MNNVMKKEILRCDQNSMYKLKFSLYIMKKEILRCDKKFNISLYECCIMKKEILSVIKTPHINI